MGGEGGRTSLGKAEVTTSLYFHRLAVRGAVEDYLKKLERSVAIKLFHSHCHMVFIS